MGRRFEATAWAVAASLSGVSTLAASDRPLRVCDACEYRTIQGAVDAASAGATIEVAPGRYTEGHLVIRKPVSLRGDQFPVIIGNGTDHVIDIVGAERVLVEGFEIRESGFSYTRDLAGIHVQKGNGCKLIGNRVIDNNFGIYVADSQSCEIRQNLVLGRPRTEADTGNGIHLWQGSHHTVVDNEVSGCRDGIYFEFVSASRIEGNHAHGNIRYGLHFMRSDRDDYTANRFSGNGAGVAVMYSRKITMQRNEFSGNRGNAAYGLLLKDIYDSQVDENRFLENTTAILMDGTDRTRFQANQIVKNGWGLRIMGSSSGNFFNGNEFRENTFDVATNTSFNENDFRRNYWSAYGGYDLNHDGVGDQPFRLASLSSVIIERVDSSFLLLHSFLFSLLDEIERALPGLIPERLLDTEPLMKPPTSPQGEIR